MTIEERVELYKSLYKECKALEPVANTLAKGYKQADPRKRLELIRELDTELAEVYMVRIPVITCGVSHRADEERIKSLEAKIIKGGSDEERAVKAIAEAKEYLEIVAGSRVRDNSKCLVF